MSRLVQYAVILFILSLSAVAKAVPPEPRDYEASYFIPNHTFLLYGYARHVSSTDKSSVSQSLAMARASYVLKFGSLFTTLSAFLPIVDMTTYVDTAGSASAGAAAATEVTHVLHASGTGDLRLFPTVGYNIEEDAKTATHTTIALTGYLTLATGTYDSAKSLNLGENRLVFEPQLIVAQRFLKIITLEAFGGVSFYTSNSDYVRGAASGSLDQDPTFAAGALLAADLSKEVYVGLSYLLEAAGEKRFISAVSTSAEEEVSPSGALHTLRATIGISLRPTTLLLLQYNQDIAGSEKTNLSRFVGMRLGQAIFF